MTTHKRQETNMKTITRRTLGVLTLAASCGAWAQTAPATTPVRITSVFPTGSGPDTVGRIIAEKLQARWSRPVLIDAKPGGAGMVAINSMKNAAGNGSELVLLDVGNVSINPLIFKNLSYDPDKDLVPVAVLYKTAFFVTVSAESPYKTLQELVAAAGDKSRKLTFGSNAVGGPIHLHSERLGTARHGPGHGGRYQQGRQRGAGAARREGEIRRLRLHPGTRSGAAGG
jgi:tripartite-type tricarboxylate transporter receptor subunit TctC